MTAKLYVRDRKEWRAWLKDNHKDAAGIWVVFYKKHTGRKSVPYEEAVEEALCFGWIDSIVKRIDSEKYMQKFTPRKSRSKWSEHNKRRAAKLIKEKRMTRAGLDAIQLAKDNGEWDKPSGESSRVEMPPAFEAALAKNSKAKSYFNSLAPSYRKQFVGWISSAKKLKPEKRGSGKRWRA